jgi:hypothetical protein
MENIAPPLELIIEVRFGLEKGQALKKTLQNYASDCFSTDKESIKWRQFIQKWLLNLEFGQSTTEIKKKLNPVRQQIIEVLEMGLRGESIYPQICALEDELFEAAKFEIEEHTSVLAIKSLIPLLMFQFPAFLVLLMGPFVAQFFDLNS